MACACLSTNVEVRGNFEELALSSAMCSQDRTHIVRLGSKHLYLPNEPVPFTFYISLYLLNQLRSLVSVVLSSCSQRATPCANKGTVVSQYSS